MIVQTVKAVARLGAAGLVAGKMQPAGAQRAVDGRQHRHQPGARHMQQAGVRPDGIEFAIGVEFVEAHDRDRDAQPFGGFLRHFGDAVGGDDVEALLQHGLGIAATAAAQFEDARAGFEALQEVGEMTRGAIEAAGDIVGRFAGIEGQCRVVGTGGHANSIASL